MKSLIKSKLLYFLMVFIVTPSNADDTEIFGVEGLAQQKHQQPNVLLVLDTSGSMSGKIYETHDTYNPNVKYKGKYHTDKKLYTNLDESQYEGHYKNRLDPETCGEAIEKLNTVGKFTTSLQSWCPWCGNGGSWVELRIGFGIRCGQGGSTHTMYHHNYMNFYDGEGQEETNRIEVLANVISELTESVSDINLGLMRYDLDGEGGMVDVAVQDVKTAGPLIREKLKEYTKNPLGDTPLEETYYEAAMYLRGETPKFGLNTEPNNSIPESISNGSYKSPIKSQCQKSHIILFSDGEPSGDMTAIGDIRSRIGTIPNLPDSLNTNCGGNGKCMDELAYYLKHSDNSSTFSGEQEITTYTIGGFDLENGVNLLRQAAAAGGGEYFAADDTEELTRAFDQIFLKIYSNSTSFSAPAVSVNAFSGTEHRDELYYALFKPEQGAKWGGNLKKYRLGANGRIYGVDASTPAIDSKSGIFIDSAKDFWNNDKNPDGPNVTLGGMANLLEPSNRVIYSDDTNYQLQNFSSIASKDTFRMTGYSDEEYEKVRKWSIGYDVLDKDIDDDTEDSRYSIGDPLHSEPAVILYGDNESNLKTTVFFGTNEGFIHAVDGDTGLEKFAFTPRSLHKNFNAYYRNTVGIQGKPYGMDGHLSLWLYDKNQNGTVFTDGSVDAGEHAYLYAGMRRGGRNYYSLDVTNDESPSLNFVIEGGYGDFWNLGQTWSKMTIAKIKFDGADRFVAFFGGGYDTNQDSNVLPTNDWVGNSIYMVDAKTGELLWWASSKFADLNIPEMVNSIPASVSAVDITGDGRVNYLFATDTGGRVFRIDFNPSGAPGAEFATGGVIASIADNNVVDNRRFYNKPNVSIVKDKQYGDYLTISIGSGHRASPISTKVVENRFYMIRDFNPYLAPKNYVMKTEAPLNKKTLAEEEQPDRSKIYNGTDALLGQQEISEEHKRLLSTGGGWFIDLPETSEKVLSDATTFGGAIFFTSFYPSGIAATPCGGDIGRSKFYAVNQRVPYPVLDLDRDGDVDSNDASVVLSAPGIAPKPVVIYREGGEKSIAIGTETIDDERYAATKPGKPNCEETNSCPKPSVCAVHNCYVTPVYWREGRNLNQ